MNLPVLSTMSRDLPSALVRGGIDGFFQCVKIQRRSLRKRKTNAIFSFIRNDPSFFKKIKRDCIMKLKGTRDIMAHGVVKNYDLAPEVDGIREVDWSTLLMNEF